MDFDAVAQSVAKQFVTVWNAPVPFFAALLLVGYVILRLTQREFATRLANSDSTITMLKERLERVETSGAMAIAAASQRHDTQPELDTDDSTQLAPSTNAPAEPKVYVRDDFDSAHVLGMFDGRTDLQATTMLQGEIGKWMIVESAVKGVSSPSEGSIMVALHAGFLALVFCSFERAVPELALLSEGDIAKIEGRIRDLTSFGISLEDCVLISSRRASA